MGRSFILTQAQRNAITYYLENGGVMSPKIRQIRLRARRMDFEQIQTDLALLKRLADLKIPVGRVRGEDLKARATIRHPNIAALKGVLVVRHAQTSKYDALINDFIDSDERRVELSFVDQEPAKLKAALRERINGRGLTEWIRAVLDVEGKVFLEKLTPEEKEK